MFKQLLPESIDNKYPGNKAALWIFTLLVLMKAAMSINSIFNGRRVAFSADGIPLEAFTPAGAQTVLALFAIWGIAQLMICLLCVLSLMRYRAMVPMLFVLLLLEHLSRKVTLQFVPIVRTGTPPGFWVNQVLLVLIVVGLVLSLWRRGEQ